jgi:two-component system NtrC family sensor kinase
LAFSITLGASVILAAAGIWNIGLQREHMTDLLGQCANGTADVIVKSTRHAMLANDPEDLDLMLASMGEQPGVERIRIFDKQGHIKRSTDPAELGRVVDMAAEQCFACHGAEQPLARLEGQARTRIFETDGGRRVLGVIAPIRNEADCSACHVHPADQQLLGVFDVQLSLDSLEAGILASERQLGLGLLVTVVAVLLLAGYLMKRHVLDPVGALTEASARVAEGDLSSRVPVTSHDEVGRMTRVWNDMVAELEHTRSGLERMSQDLEQSVAEKTEELEAAHRSMLLVEKMASLGKLSAVVAHELNNPLAGIAVYARLLGKRVGKGSKDGETLRILDVIAGEAVRCGDIVRNLLLFSRDARVRITDEDPAALLDRCAMLFQHQADLQGVTVTLDVADGTPRVHCDASQVQQLVLGLAINAIEAMPEGGELTLRAVADGDELVLEIEDTGCGIPAEHLGHIFEPFWTTKSTARASGLGLAVAYGIAKRHQGRIDVASLPDEGTTFTVRLPIQPTEGSQQPAVLLEETVE